MTNYQNNITKEARHHFSKYHDAQRITLAKEKKIIKLAKYMNRSHYGK